VQERPDQDDRAGDRDEDVDGVVRVRRTGWTHPIQRGSNPSRPALKISRAWELMAEISTPIVEVMPAS
jgi:hypothetical protein